MYIFEFEMLEDTYITTVVERTLFPPWGLNGGKEALANNCYVIDQEKKSIEVPKATRVSVTKGKRILLQCGGGGGYGDPKERETFKVLDDYKQGYISEQYIKKNHPNVKLS